MCIEKSKLKEQTITCETPFRCILNRFKSQFPVEIALSNPWVMILCLLMGCKKNSIQKEIETHSTYNEDIMRSQVPNFI